MKIGSNSNGISLISLVITIIVIIILAAVVIFSGMGTPEKAQLSKVISDIDSVQTAVNQAYYGLYTEKALTGEVWTLSQFYEAVATGELNREKLSGEGLIEISKNSLVDINLPTYEGKSWYIAVTNLSDTIKIGSAVLWPAFESDGKTYASLLDTQIGGGNGITFTDPSGENAVLRVLTANEMKNPNWNTDKIKMVLQASGEETQVPIPVGFDYLLGTGDTGLVVTDTDKNELVWIPVENAKKMYATNADGITLSGTNVKTYKYGVGSIKAMAQPGTSGIREPDLVVDCDTDLTNLAKAGFTGENALNDFAQDLVDEFNAMIESVEKYGGFYVGRYELGYDGTNVVCRANVLELTAVAYTSFDEYGDCAGSPETVTWYGLYKACKGFSTANLHSSMMWGCQWEAMIDVIGDNFVSKSNKRNLTGQYGDEIGHVCDTSTGVSDWLATAYSTKYRVTRGGCYSLDSSASGRYADTANGNYRDCGTRVQLYIK